MKHKTVQVTIKKSKKVYRYVATYKIKKNIYSGLMVVKTEVEVISLHGDTIEEFLKPIKHSIRGRHSLDFLKSGLSNCVLDGVPIDKAEFLSLMSDKFTEDRYKVFLSDAALERVRKSGRCLEVIKPPREKEFYKQLERLIDFPVKVLYHGTHSSNLSSILMDGFVASKSGAFGPGLYVGPYEKASGYVDKLGFFPRTKRHWRLDEIYESQAGAMIELEVLLGKCIQVTDTEKVGKVSPASLNCDSIYYEGFTRPEYCLRSPDQVLIKRITLV